MSMPPTLNSGAFKTDLKTNPRLMPTPPKPGTSTAVDETTYDDDIQNIPDEATTTIDDDYTVYDDSTVYIKLFYTTDFDATSHFPVASSRSRYCYHLVNCYNGNIHVETMQTRTSAAYIAAYELTFQHWSRSL